MEATSAKCMRSHCAENPPVTTRAWHIPLPDGPGQVRLPVRQVDLSKVSFYRADSRLVPSQWETSLYTNAVSHWLDANLKLALFYIFCISTLKKCTILRVGQVKKNLYVEPWLQRWPELQFPISNTMTWKCYFDEISITGCTGSCQNDKFQCC